MEKRSSLWFCSQAHWKSRWINKSSQMELCNSRAKRFSMVGRSVLIVDGLFKWFSCKTTKVHVQTCSSPPEHLSFWNCMFVNLEWWRRLETKHYSKANIVGNSETFERWTKHWQPCSAVTIEHVQKRSKKIFGDSEKFCCEM